MSKVCPRCGSNFMSLVTEIQLCISCRNHVLNLVSAAKLGNCNSCRSTFVTVSNIPRFGLVCSTCRFKISTSYLSLPFSAKCPICGQILDSKGICVPCNNDFRYGG